MAEKGNTLQILAETANSDCSTGVPSLPKMEDMPGAAPAVPPTPEPIGSYDYACRT